MIVLEDFTTEFGTIRVTRSRKNGVCTYYQDKCFHSQANSDGVSTCVYIHVMDALIRQAGARRVLMIGCAGGTLATMLHRQGCAVTVVDINPHAFTIAKRYFLMPEDVTCVVGDGYDYVRDAGIRFDAIAIDAFANDGTIPGCFATPSFFTMAQAALEEGGIIAMNIMVAHDLDLQADRIAFAMQDAGMPSMLFDWPGMTDRNVIAVGGVIKNRRIFSGKEPKWIRQDLRGLVCRHPTEAARRDHESS